MAQDYISVIRQRHVFAVAKAQRLRNQLDLIEQERDELETALRVLEKIAAPETPQPDNSRAADAVEGSGPTMPELITKALEGGARPIADLTSAVMALSDKELDANNIRSTAWRMWKADRIGRSGDYYHLPGKPPERTGDIFEDVIG